MTISMILGVTRVVVIRGDPQLLPEIDRNSESVISFSSPPAHTVRLITSLYSLLFSMVAAIFGSMSAGAILPLRYNFKGGCFYKVGDGRLYLYSFLALACVIFVSLAVVGFFARSLFAYRSKFVRWHLRRNLGRLLLMIAASIMLIVSTALRTEKKGDLLFPLLFLAVFVIGNLAISASDSILLIFPPNRTFRITYYATLISATFFFLSSRVYLFASPDSACGFSSGERPVGVTVLMIITEGLNSIVLIGMTKMFVVKSGDIRTPMVELDRSALWSIALFGEKDTGLTARV